MQRIIATFLASLMETRIIISEKVFLLDKPIFKAHNKDARFTSFWCLFCYL